MRFRSAVRRGQSRQCCRHLVPDQPVSVLGDQAYREQEGDPDPRGEITKPPLEGPGSLPGQRRRVRTASDRLTPRMPRREPARGHSDRPGDGLQSWRQGGMTQQRSSLVTSCLGRLPVSTGLRCLCSAIAEGPLPDLLRERRERQLPGLGTSPLRRRGHPRRAQRGRRPGSPHDDRRSRHGRLAGGSHHRVVLRDPSRGCRRRLRPAQRTKSLAPTGEVTVVSLVVHPVLA